MPVLWVYLIILYVQQAVEDTSGSKCVRALNMALLYMQRIQRVLNMAQYAAIMPEYASSKVSK